MVLKEVLLDVVGSPSTNIHQSRPMEIHIRICLYKTPILGLMDRGLAMHYECTILLEVMRLARKQASDTKRPGVRRIQSLFVF